jgi:hypothetical protein
MTCGIADACGAHPLSPGAPQGLGGSAGLTATSTLHRAHS